jgi:F-type H+-transporting ATPase subunit delta
MKEKGVARRYAKAILETAKNDIEVKAVGGELGLFSEMYSASKELRKVILHPGVGGDLKKNIIQELAKKLKLSAGTVKALEVMQENGRIGLIAEISNSFNEMAEVRLGEVTVRVDSAHDVSKSDSGELEKLFSAITGKKAKITIKVDNSLIGGIVARVGSKVYDGSISNQLRLMKIKLGQEV